jgi:hypothetical protein
LNIFLKFISKVNAYINFPICPVCKKIGTGKQIFCSDKCQANYNEKYDRLIQWDKINITDRVPTLQQWKERDDIIQQCEDDWSNKD